MSGPGSESAAVEGAADPEPAGDELSAVLGSPEEIDHSSVQAALEALAADDEETRQVASRVLGLAARRSPELVVPAVAPIAGLLDAEETRRDAERAFACMSRYGAGPVERAIRALDDSHLRGLCRKALWGQPTGNVEALQDGSIRDVVVVPDDEETPARAAVYGDGRKTSEDDHWSQADRPREACTTETDATRQRPPTETPVEPEPVDRCHGSFRPVAVLHDGDVVDVLKTIYPRPDGAPTAATLKRFSVDATDRLLEAFDYRTSVWRSLSSHEAILPVVDWGTEPGPWLATEHVVGGDITGVAGKLSPAAAGWMLSQVADALSYAHQQGVVHGSVTPYSITLSPVLSEPEAWPVPRLTDWGVGAVLAAHGGCNSAVPAAYAAPEVRSPERYGCIDDPTDIYQFGATAYAAFVGQPPFEATEKRDDAGERPLVSEAVPALPAALDVVISKCLSERKAKRYETVHAMATEFRDALRGG